MFKLRSLGVSEFTIASLQMLIMKWFILMDCCNGDESIRVRGYRLVVGDVDAAQVARSINLEDLSSRIILQSEKRKNIKTDGSHS